MRPGSIVIVNLRSPTERLLGRLVEVSSAGVTIRGLDLASFDHWIDAVASGHESGVSPSTLFLPMHRIEKLILDEGVGVIPSLANTFESKVGTRIDEYLEY